MPAAAEHPPLHTKGATVCQPSFKRSVANRALLRLPSSRSVTIGVGRRKGARTQARAKKSLSSWQAAETKQEQESENFNQKLRERINTQLLLPESMIAVSLHLPLYLKKKKKKKVAGNSIPKCFSFPQPKKWMQTLKRRVVLSGMGLNSGQEETIYIHPARPTEGRYFVRLPSRDGEDEDASVSSAVFKRFIDESEIDGEDQEHMALQSLRYSLMDDEDRRVRFHCRLPLATDSGGCGCGELSLTSPPLRMQMEYERLHGKEDESPGANSADEEVVHPEQDEERERGEAEGATEQHQGQLQTPRRHMPEAEFHPGFEGEVRIPATLDHVKRADELGISLAAVGSQSEPSSRAEVHGVERLLAALEACGIDCVRVEVQGSGEVPILDGAAEYFVAALSEAGVVPALTDEGEFAERFAVQPEAPISISSGDSFVFINPDTAQKVAMGVDFTGTSEAIGRQWASWTPEDSSFYDAIAPARKHMTIANFHAFTSQGKLRAGGTSSLVIATADSFLRHPPRFHRSEFARYKVLEMLGCFALAHTPAFVGWPVAHVVAFNAPIGMLLEAAQEVYKLSLQVAQYQFQAMELQEAGKSSSDVAAELGDPPQGSFARPYYSPPLGPDSA